MQGYFSESSLKQCETLLSTTYDYTRCVRPDGSAYGTGGKCRKGVEQELFESSGGIQTSSSGGLISGSVFPKERKARRFSSALDDAKDAMANYNKLKNIPVGRKKRYESLYNSAENLLDSLWSVSRNEGYDKAVSLLNDHSHVASRLFDLLTRNSNSSLVDKEDLREVTHQLYRWGYSNLRYDFFANGKYKRY